MEVEDDVQMDFEEEDNAWEEEIPGSQNRR